MSGVPPFNGQWTSYKALDHREAAVQIKDRLIRPEFGRNFIVLDEENVRRRPTSVLCLALYRKFLRRWPSGEHHHTINRRRTFCWRRTVIIKYHARHGQLTTSSRTTLHTARVRGPFCHIPLGYERQYLARTYTAFKSQVLFWGGDLHHPANGVLTFLFHQVLSSPSRASHEVPIISALSREINCHYRILR